jgi:hypothetical protein
VLLGPVIGYEVPVKRVSRARPKTVALASIVAKNPTVAPAPPPEDKLPEPVNDPLLLALSALELGEELREQRDVMIAERAELNRAHQKFVDEQWLASRQRLRAQLEDCKLRGKAVEEELNELENNIGLAQLAWNKAAAIANEALTPHREALIAGQYISEWPVPKRFN